MKPLSALILVTLIVLFGEALADFFALNVAWLTGGFLVGLSAAVIFSTKKSNQNAK